MAWAAYSVRRRSRIITVSITCFPFLRLNRRKQSIIALLLLISSAAAHSLPATREMDSDNVAFVDRRYGGKLSGAGTTAA